MSLHDDEIRVKMDTEMRKGLYLKAVYIPQTTKRRLSSLMRGIVEHDSQTIRNISETGFIESNVRNQITR